MQGSQIVKRLPSNSDYGCGRSVIHGKRSNPDSHRILPSVGVPEGVVNSSGMLSHMSMSTRISNLWTMFRRESYGKLSITILGKFKTFPIYLIN